MNKTIKERKEYYIEFSDEERQDLKFEENQKFSIHTENDGIRLVPFAKIDLDLSEFSRENLEFLISESVEKDISVNEVFNNVLEKVIGNYEKRPCIQNS